VLRDMTQNDVEGIARMEAGIHAHPWTRGNFRDALVCGNICKVLEDNGAMIGYFVMIKAVDEVELLDIGVASARQRQGIGKRLLADALKLAGDLGALRVLLEVRSSNIAARALYAKAGFNEMGIRRGYYPAAGNAREDAVMMEFKL
jgi:ribosomal-protein-alanine N-acetyltransferase